MLSTAMIRISPHFTQKYSLYTMQNGVQVYMAGTAFQEDRLLCEKQLAEALYDRIVSQSALPRALNGFYGAVFVSEQQAWLVADHIRTHPLFYALIDDTLYVGDDHQKIAETADLRQPDSNGELFMRLCGFSIQGHTLLQDLWHVQADETICVHRSSGKIERFSNGVQNFTYGEGCCPESELVQFHDQLLSNATDRLVKIADGRTVVIPLSGGHDSLLLACLLRARDYKRVVTFTYGREANAESLVSKERAHRLGFPWHFVEYTEHNFSQAWQWAVDEGLITRTSNYCALPHIQDFLAIRELTAQGGIPPNSVILPGHTPIGISTPSDLQPEKEYPPSYVSEYIIRTYADYDARLLKRHYSQVQHAVLSITRCSEARNSATAVQQSIGRWFWQTKEPNYLANSLSWYEEFGHDWWLPLWDIDYFSFQKRLPEHLLLGRAWYEWYVEMLYAKLLNGPTRPSVNTYKPRQSKPYHWGRRTRLGILLKRLKVYRAIRRNPFCFNAIYNQRELFWRTLRGRHLLSKYADQTVELVKREVAK